MLGGYFLKKLNKNLCIGALFSGIAILSNYFIKLPDFVCGFCIGISLVFYIIGMYEINHDISKIKIFKSNFFKKGLNK